MKMKTMQVMMITAIFLICSFGFSHQALPDRWKSQIEASREDVKKILDHIRGEGKHKTFDRLAVLGDTWGPRMSGTKALEDAILYIRDNLTAENFENVDLEQVMVPSWSRGKEYGTIITEHYNKSMFIMALGTSIGTNGTELVGETFVVESFDELDSNAAQANGKIVVFNQPFITYSQSGQYRREGAWRAKKVGAIAVLIRSVTGRSIYSPHTGVQDYHTDYDPIPAACIPVEDAQLLWRFQKRGKPLRVSIVMEAAPGPMVPSNNLVAEIVGSEYPDQTVIFGGHIDTWDVTDGSMDDGGGVMMAWEAFSVMKRLELKPKRTIRLVLWTSEEYGLIGSEEYFNVHKEEVNRTSLVMQADGGSFKPYGVRFSNGPDGSSPPNHDGGIARSIMEEIVGMLADFNATEVVHGNGASSDTGIWVSAGVPGVEIHNANENYFDYHHTYGDAMNALDADDLDGCTAVWATVAYTVANMDDLLPRERGNYISSVSESSTYFINHSLIGFLAAVAIRLVL